MNANIAKLRDNSEKHRRGSTKIVTASEAKRFYGILLLVESTWGNNTPVLRDHFKQVKRSLGKKFQMGVNRFGVLRTSFYVSNTDLLWLADNWHLAASSHLTEVKVVVGDEEVDEYQPSKVTKKAAEVSGDPIPLAYFPRKPHPNGLLYYFYTTYVRNALAEQEKMPYTVDIHIHLKQGDSAPVDVIKQFCDRWALDGNKPIVVLDAGFSSWELLTYIKRWGGQVVMSASENSLAYLWGALSTSLPPNTWRAATNDDRVHASCHAIVTEKGDKAYQYILSTLGNATPIMYPQQVQDIASAPVDPTATQIPLYTVETLNKMTILDMKEICRNYNIKHGRKKEDFVRLILARSVSMNRDRSLIKDMATHIATNATHDPAPLHNFYKSHFNFIDLNDRHFYAVRDHHGNHNWRSHMLQSILRYAVLNAWTHASIQEYEAWKDFHCKLGRELALFDL